jgi:hypothetical protein
MSSLKEPAAAELLAPELLAPEQARLAVAAEAWVPAARVL